MKSDDVVGRVKTYEAIVKGRERAEARHSRVVPRADEGAAEPRRWICAYRTPTATRWTSSRITMTTIWALTIPTSRVGDDVMVRERARRRLQHRRRRRGRPNLKKKMRNPMPEDLESDDLFADLPEDDLIRIWPAARRAPRGATGHASTNLEKERVRFMEFNAFDSIKIGLASPDQIRALELRRGEKARDHQLPHPETGARRPVLRAHLWADQGLGVPLRQVQAHPLQGQDLRPLRRRSDRAPRCAASVWAISSWPRRSRHIWYFKGIPSRIGLMLDISPPPAGKGAVLCRLYRDWIPGFTTSGGKAAAHAKKSTATCGRRYEDEFKAGMGAEAVKELLQKHRPGKAQPTSCMQELEDATRPEARAPAQAAGGRGGLPHLRQQARSG